MTIVPSGFDEVPTPSGRLILTAKRFVAPDPERVLAAIDPAGTVVCLNPERELMEWPHYPMWLRAAQPDRAIWFSMPDWEAPPLEESLVLLEALTERLQAGRTIIMHCSHGQGRTGTMAVGTLMMLSIARYIAEASVAQHRPGAGPQPGSQSHLIDTLTDHLTNGRTSPDSIR